MFIVLFMVNFTCVYVGGIGFLLQKGLRYMANASPTHAISVTAKLRMYVVYCSQFMCLVELLAVSYLWMVCVGTSRDHSTTHATQAMALSNWRIQNDKAQRQFL